MDYQTLGWWDDQSSDPAYHIVDCFIFGFLDSAFWYCSFSIIYEPLNSGTIMLLHKLFQFLMECNLASKYGKQWKPSKKSCEFSTLFFHLWKKKEKIVHFTFTVINVRVSKIELRNTLVHLLLKMSVELFSLKQSYKKFGICLIFSMSKGVSIS